MKVDLSADLGEGSPDEEAIWPLIDSANVACGGHYGDESTMRAAVAMATLHRVRLGAHPSYPDREGFGRRSIAINDDDLCASLIDQLSALRTIAPIVHVKPHGALYNDAHHDQRKAQTIVEAIFAVDPSLSLVAADQSKAAMLARERGLRVIREAFADRRYEPDGSLTPRKIAGATLSVEEAAAQAASLVSHGVVVARDGSRVEIQFDTICIHADMEHAVERLKAIRRTLAGHHLSH
jgi:UPF0271 protein